MSEAQLLEVSAPEAIDERAERLRAAAARRRPSLWRRPLSVVGLTIAAVGSWRRFWRPGSAATARRRPRPTCTGPRLGALFRDRRPRAGRFARVVYGARVTLPLSIMLVALAATVGGVLGGIAGYLGGIVDEVIMRLADLVFAFPTIILAMAVAAALGPNLRNAVFAIIIVSWPLYARVTRSLVLAARELDYVQASRLLGASRPGGARDRDPPEHRRPDRRARDARPRQRGALARGASRSSASARSRRRRSGGRWSRRVHSPSTAGGSAPSRASRSSPP